jgi:hypothetical protein
MGGTAGLIRLVLAGLFLLARVALGVPASAAPMPPAMHAQMAAHVETVQAATSPATRAATNDPCCPDHAMPCCCGPGLCGTALAVLPAPAWLGPAHACAVAFESGRAPAVTGIRARPAIHPPRI